jgi:hypothetical protein
MFKPVLRRGFMADSVWIWAALAFSRFAAVFAHLGASQGLR